MWKIDCPRDAQCPHPYLQSPSRARTTILSPSSITTISTSASPVNTIANHDNDSGIKSRILLFTSRPDKLHRSSGSERVPQSQSGPRLLLSTRRSVPAPSPIATNLAGVTINVLYSDIETARTVPASWDPASRVGSAGLGWVVGPHRLLGVVPVRPGTSGCVRNPVQQRGYVYPAYDGNSGAQTQPPV